MSYIPSSTSKILNVVANTTVVIPAGHSILQIVVREKAGNAIVGGIIVGTTSGGTDVLASFAISANSLEVIPGSNITKRAFSVTADTTLHVQTTLGWGSANLDIFFVLRNFN